MNSFAYTLSRIHRFNKVFLFLFVVFSVAYWMRGHLAVEAHKWVKSTIPVVSQSHPREMCGWQTRTIIAW